MAERQSFPKDEMRGRADAVSRRGLCRLLAGGVLLGPMSTGVPAPTRLATGMAEPKHRPALVVASPAQGALASWAHRLQRPFSDVLGRPPALSFAGGTDGVTGANQFMARVPPDGEQALFYPGSVAAAWLAGDSLLRADPAELPHLLAISGPGLLMTRRGLPTAGREARPLRLAITTPFGCGVSALLALDLLGIPATPVQAPATPWIAARSGLVDAVFVHGFAAARVMARLRALGFAPSLVFGRHAGDIPDMASLLAPEQQADPLASAWRETAKAATLCAVLALPRLTPGVAIRRWRDASDQVSADPLLASAAAQSGLALAAGPALRPVTLDDAARAAFRRWLSERLTATML